jgi:hypothetical protein
MPAINVAKTDTFETQRVKINDIGTQIFSISAGGSDLSTGNLKLGDGTKVVPSLAFNTDGTLGIFKPDLKAIGLVSGEKRIVDFRETQVVSFKDINVQNKILTTAGLVVTAVGSNYDSGSYVNVPVIGGTGLGATLNIDVTEFLGTFTTIGTGYNEGSFFTPVETDGSGTGAEIAFSVEGILGNITNAGSAYKPGSYVDVPISNINSSGSGAIADIDILGAQTVTASITNGGSAYPGPDGVVAGVTLTGGTGVVTPITADITLTSGVVTDVTITDNGDGYVSGDVLSADAQDLSGDSAAAGSGFAFTISNITYDGVIDLVTITNSGQGYQQLDVISASDANLGGGGGSGFEFSISSQPGIPQNLEFASKGQGYAVGDNITLPGATNNVSTDLLGSVATTGDITSGSTDITNLATTTGILQGMTVIDENGFFPEGTTVTNISGTTITVSAAATSTLAAGNVSFESPGGNFTAVQVSASQATSIGQGAVVTKVSGSGDLAAGVITTVTAIDTATNTLTLSDQPALAGAVVLDFTPAYGSPTTEVNFQLETLGSIDAVTVLEGGSGYDVADVVTISATDLTQPITKVVTTVNVEVLTFAVSVPSNAISVGDTADIGGGDAGTVQAQVLSVGTSGGNITEVIVESVGAAAGQTIQIGSGTAYSIDTATNVNRFALDGVVGDSFTIFLSNKYVFDVSDPSNTGHIFALSDIPGGDTGRGLVTGITSNVSLSAVVGVTDSTGILPGMEVSIQSGNAVIPAGTKVLSVDSGTQITLDAAATGSGSSVLDFIGTEFTDNVVRTANDLSLKVTSTTPNLYYYCTVHPNMGGSDNFEGVLTYNANNPKVFGTGGTIQVNAIGSTDVISLDVETGQITSIGSQGTTLSFGSGTITDLTSTTSKTTDTHVVGMIKSDSDGDDIIEMNAGVSTNFSYGNVNIGSSIQIENTTGNITSSGAIKTTGNFNSGDKLEITNNVISTVPGEDLVFEPASANQTKIIGTTALVIPAGNISQRPLPNVSYDGSIRYNTETNQYEGYNASTTSWSSLGGIRDLDGNTTILAEETIGSNDNTLWFINDNVNTVRFTPEYQEFVNVKKVRSPNTSAPDYTEWRANVPVTLGEYLKYRNNIYEVTQAGTTATSGSEPIHTTGVLTNGSAELTWYISAVSSLTFEEISELRIDPLGFTDLVVNNEIRLSNNNILTTTNDLQIEPSSGKKVKIIAPTSLVLPVGDNNQKGSPEQGSIRYNTDDSQFEGYDGIQWGGLGGVKDIDQDTLIKAEVGPGTDEDTLFFVTANNEALRLTANDLEFDLVDSIKSTNTDSLAVNLSLLTFNNNETTLDNTSADVSFLHCSKEFFDIGLSTGLAVDPLLRLSDVGDITFNLGFGTSTFTGIKLFDETLQNFELAHVKVSTTKVALIRGSINQNEAVLFDPSTDECADVQLIAHNITTGDKEVVKYTVFSKGTDIFHTEIANMRTNGQQVLTSFDFNAFNECRLTFILNTDISVGNNVNITVVSQITKK